MLDNDKRKVTPEFVLINSRLYILSTQYSVLRRDAVLVA